MKFPFHMLPFQGTFVRSFSGVFIMMIFVHFDSSVRVLGEISGCKSGRKRSIHHEVVRHNNIDDDVSGNPKPKKAAAASVLGIVSPYIFVYIYIYTVPTLCHPQEIINHHDPSRWVEKSGGELCKGSRSSCFTASPTISVKTTSSV